MNYHELNQIIRYIKKSFPCNRCQKDYTLDEIEVISTFEDQGLFHLACAKCQNNLIVHVTISDEETAVNKQEPLEKDLSRKHRSIKSNGKERKTTAGDSRRAANIATAAIISSNDVLDMINYFKNFNGDFKKLFSAKK